jgi:hypothetical protein
MTQSFFKVARVLALALGIMGLAACPGYIDSSRWIHDGGIRTPSALDTGPPATMVVDATLAPKPVPDAAPAPSVPDASVTGPDAVAAALPDAAPAAESWCADPAEITARILEPSCGTCHGSVGRAGGLDLISPGARARLVDVRSRACRDEALVYLTPSLGGHFFRKLENAVDGCGERMPAGGAPRLSAVEIQCLEVWIGSPRPPP